MSEVPGEKALRGIFVDANRAKAEQGALWSQPDPRGYFHIVDGLDCVMPRVAQPIVAQLADARIRSRGGPITVLELGCGYGVNGALLKYGFSFDMLRERYATPAVQKLPPAELLALDRHLSAAWPARPDVRVIGLDASRAAAAYAEGCGFVDRGIAVDLETDNFTAEAAAELASVDLIVSTGSFGRIGKKTFDKLARAMAGTSVPWVASFVLRMSDYQQIAKTLRRYGLVTERFEGATFVQRRFRDEDEMRATLHTLEAHGVNPTGKESRGWLHAELFVSRPWTDIESEPVTRLISAPGDAERGAVAGLAVRPRVPILRASSASSQRLPQ